ncbi:MAG: Glu-tRNA(Gln) amidotransferase subunit GatD [Thaumarchaeota archaeon]|nr:Glu-tRNA(Gln) amidotransferase subunit GatD [Nitrososphaerota archaeon]
MGVLKVQMGDKSRQGEDNASIGDLVEVVTDTTTFNGSLLPRYSYLKHDHVVIKLDNGYNIGIQRDKIIRISKISAGRTPTFSKGKQPEIDGSLPRIAILSTGGTIASRIDYRTGGVHPALTAEDIHTAIPELSKYGRIDTEIIFSLLSENLESSHWVQIALAATEKIKKGYNGIIITQGTDTMGYTAAALSFALAESPIPIVLVGAQRSSDRPSSDATLNMIGAMILTTSAKFAGVYLVMHSDTSDDSLAVHMGTRVRKNHTSKRNAFESIDISPVAYIRDGKIEQISPNLPERKDSTKFESRADFDPHVALIKFYPGFDPLIIENLVKSGHRGIVIEGTGLGHISHSTHSTIKKAIESGVLIAMASQCIWGQVRMSVYETGYDLLSLGVIPLDNMLSETALVKMRWVLSNSKSSSEARELLLLNIAGEFAPSPPIRE